MAEETKDTEKTAKQFRLSEIETHKSAKSLWVVIHNKVYDVTKFIDEHPGGEEVLIEQGGKNATENFEDVGHSTDARDLMKSYYIGDLAEEDRPEKDFPVKSAYTESEPPEKFSFTKWLLPAVIAFTVAMLYRYYINSGK